MKIELAGLFACFYMLNICFHYIEINWTKMILNLEVNKVEQKLNEMNWTETEWTTQAESKDRMSVFLLTIF